MLFWYYHNLVFFRGVVIVDDGSDLVGQLARLDMCAHLAGRQQVGVSKGPSGGCGAAFTANQFTVTAADALGFR